MGEPVCLHCVLQRNMRPRTLGSQMVEVCPGGC